MQRISHFFAIGILCLALLNFSFALFPFQNQSSEIGVVSADKMNVLYIGVDNPVSVAIADVPIDQTQVSITNGQISPTDQKGTYNVRVTSPGRTTIEVSGKDRQGRLLNAKGEFRIKRIPDPQAVIGGKTGGSISIATFKAQRGMTLNLKNFDFDARFSIVNFDISSYKPRGDINSTDNQGATFDKSTLELIQKGQIGDIYYFDNIQVKGPDGTRRKLPTLSFKLR